MSRIRHSLVRKQVVLSLERKKKRGRGGREMKTRGRRDEEEEGMRRGRGGREMKRRGKRDEEGEER